MERRADPETAYPAWKAGILAFELTAQVKTQSLHFSLMSETQKEDGAFRRVRTYNTAAQDRFIDSSLVNYVYLIF